MLSVSEEGQREGEITANNRSAYQSLNEFRQRAFPHRSPDSTIWIRICMQPEKCIIFCNEIYIIYCWFVCIICVLFGSSAETLVNVFQGSQILDNFNSDKVHY